MSSAARRLLRASIEAAGHEAKLQETYDAPLVNDIFRHSVKKQTGVSLKYMLDFGQKPIEKQMILSAQFLHNELPIRLAHRVAELENLPFGLSSMKPVLKVPPLKQLSLQGVCQAELHLWHCVTDTCCSGYIGAIGQTTLPNALHKTPA